MTRRLRFPLLGAMVGGAVAAASCGDPENMLSPAGSAARRIAHLGWFVLLTFSVVTIVMWGLVFWLAARRRGTLAHHLPWNAPEDRRWIVIGGFAIPVLVLGTIFVVMLKSMAAFPMGDDEMHATAAEVRVIGHQWWWEVQYPAVRAQDTIVTANEIHIPAGRPIDIELRSSDVIHSFWVPRLHGKVDLFPGQVVNRIRVEADAPGRYYGQCSEYCGPQHAHMLLLVSADRPADYQAWLDRQRAPAAAPGQAFAERGREVFMTGQCALCHSIRGTEAQGKVGPDLTHIGSRAGIASNSLRNDTASLAAWVTHAQSLKPSAIMPNITAFTGEDLRALVAYLQGLK
jgi:cytochrome c oxidase subunit 2